jgi:hypothetical protein
MHPTVKEEEHIETRIREERNMKHSNHGFLLSLLDEKHFILKQVASSSALVIFELQESVFCKPLR